MESRQEETKTLDIKNPKFSLLRKLLKKQVYCESLGLVTPSDFFGGPSEYNHGDEKQEQRVMSKDLPD